MGNDNEKIDIAIDVASVAKLARLKIDDSEIKQLQKDMNKIVNYIDQFSELDLHDVEPTIHAAQFNNVWRDDKSFKGNFSENILKNAPALVDDELIKVPQVLAGDSE